MSRPIGFGLIGCGVWGEAHAHTYSVLANTKLVAVCDQNQERAKQFAQKYDSTDYYNDANALLKNEQIDAISIVTPDFPHTNLNMTELEAGKLIFVEKLLYRTIENCSGN